MEQHNEGSFSKNLITAALVASFIIGGISGGVFGVLAVTQPQVSTWVQRHILNSSSLSATSNRIADQGTLKVEEESATIDVVKEVAPAVVNIVVKQDLSALSDSTDPFNNFFGFPFRQSIPEGKQEVGAGSGFIITSDGMIVTNKHVVSSTDAGVNPEYTVVLNDGTTYDATVVDTDPFNDLAIVKIEATGLPTVELGDSESVQIGQTVVAIGNALGEFTNTVTKGVVSGLSRTITAGDNNGSSETLENIIQTDAAINFGNSGGPLINLAGQVIGVNTAISQQGQLIGFAIPINQAKTVIDSVQKNGKIVRPYIGVRYSLIDEALATANDLPVQYGALVVKGQSATDLAVVPGSPADKAGLVENDIILEINGKKIDENNSLSSMIRSYAPGDEVTLKVLHDGDEKEVVLVLEEFTQ